MGGEARSSAALPLDRSPIEKVRTVAHYVARRGELIDCLFCLQKRWKLYRRQNGNGAGSRVIARRQEIHGDMWTTSWARKSSGTAV